MKLRYKIIIATMIIISVAPIFKINVYDGNKLITSRASVVSIIIRDIIDGTIGTKL